VLSDSLSGSEDAGVAVAVCMSSRGLVLGDGSPGVSMHDPLLLVQQDCHLVAQVLDLQPQRPAHHI